MRKFIRASRFSVRSLGLAAVVLALASLSVEAATELAKINDQVITLEDFNKKYQDNLKFFQLRAPSKKGVLDDLIKRELGVQEARKMGLDRDPEVIERINTVLYNALLEKKLSAEFEKINISDSEAKDYYAKNPEVRISHIYIEAKKPEEAAEAQKKIKDIQDQIRQGKMTFAEAAQKFSQAADAATGGDLDFRTRDRLEPVLYEAALKLKSPGSMAQAPVRSPTGFHLIKLTAIRSWDDISDKASVKRAVFAQRRLDIFERYMKDLRAQNKVTVKAELIKD